MSTMKSVLPLTCFFTLGAQAPVQTTAAPAAPQHKRGIRRRKKADTLAKEAAKPAEPVVRDLHDLKISPSV